jgi:ATP-dependent RNA helicase DeaD
VSIKAKTATAETIRQRMWPVSGMHKLDALTRILEVEPFDAIIIFVRTRIVTTELADRLAARGYAAAALSGDLPQAQREKMVERLKKGSLDILVATDVAARGLDVDAISHIIHYNLPDDTETYTHRSGRTARAGRSGISMALATPREMGRVRHIERTNAMRFELARFPDGRAICKRQLDGFVNRIIETPVDREAFADYLPAVSQALAGLDREELILRFMAPGFNRFMDDYRKAGDINAAARPSKAGSNRSVRPEKPEKGGHARPDMPGARRFFINVGRLDKINEGAIVRLVCDHSGIRSQQIGRIELKREFSFFEVARGAADKVRRRLKDVQLDGRRVTVSDAGHKKNRGGGQRRAAG